MRRSSICRLAYRSVRAEPSGIGWQTDYPYAEINLTTRLSELTKTRVSRDMNQRPNFYVVRPLDATLFNCPFIVASDAGTAGFRDDEAEHLRDYLLKGGFFWADDFWGNEAWDQWSSQIGRVLPPEQYPIEDVALTTRCCTACSTSSRFRRSRTSSSGGGAVERRRRSAAPTAPSCICG
jgi:hypothetical protein